MAKDTRIDFVTTTERKEWLKTTALRQEISVSQLLNRLIRNRMLQEEKHTKETNKKTTNEDDTNIARYCINGKIYYIPEGCTSDGIHIIKDDGTYMTTEEYLKS